MGIRAFAAHTKGGLLEEITYEPRKLEDNHIEIRIEHCGVCYSDPALIDDEFGISSYPLIPGHEIIGTVEAMGSAVKNVKKGQRVGVGWQSSSCGHCRFCRAGDEKFCGEAEYTAVRGFGGFAEAVRCNARCAIPIPDEIPASLAGPLMCGGSTVYAPMASYNLRPGQRIGVIGIGGLGHLALQFARSMGAEVTAFSSTTDKEEEARSMGAHHFIATKDNDGFFDENAGQFDFILSTIFANFDWNRWMGLLAPRGTFCHVGIPSKNLEINALSVVIGDKKLVGSNIGSPLDMEDMVTFACLHDIRPKTEHFRFEQVNEAIAHLKAGKARYRAVLDIVSS